MLLTCFTVSGNSSVRTTMVSIAMLNNQGAPRPWWKYRSTCPKTATMGLKMLWKNSAMALIIRFSFYRVESSLGEGVAAHQPSGTHPTPSQTTVLLYGLARIEGSTRREPARSRQHGGDDPTVGFDQRDAAAPYQHTDPVQAFRSLSESPILRSDRANSSSSSRKSASAAAGRADTTRSRSPGISGRA